MNYSKREPMDRSMIDKVSIIIPTYGRSLRLKEAIESVLSQTYKNIEVIVVDDNGIGTNNQIETEKSIEIYKDKIKYIKMSKNSGGSLARNQGIKKSTSKYISFLDDDDIFYPDKIQKQMDEMKKDLTVELVGCSMDIFSEEKQKKIGHADCKIDDIKEMIFGAVSFTPMFLIKKTKLLEVGMFTDTPRFQDYVLIIKLLEIGIKKIVINEPLFRHNIHAGERITYTKKYEEAFKIKEKIEEKHVKNFSKDEKNKLIISRKLDRINSLQNMDNRNRKKEFELLFEIFKIFLKEKKFFYFKKIIRSSVNIVIKFF